MKNRWVLILITFIWLTITATVMAEVPVFEKIETRNSVQVLTENYLKGRGFFQVVCLVGEMDEDGNFSPDNAGARTITIVNVPGNFLRRDLTVAMFTRVLALEPADPLTDIDAIFTAYWRLLLERHLLGDIPLEEIHMDTDIEPYVDDMITLIKGGPLAAILDVSPTTLALADASEGTIEISNTGIDTLTWKGSGLGSRIELSPPNGNLSEEQSQEVTVTIDRSGLSAGEYSTDFSIASTGGNQQIDISIVIAPPVLELSTISLDFGEELTELTFEISNTGEAQLNWQLNPSNQRIACDPASGSTTDETETITVTVNRTGLPANTYNETIVVQTNAGNQDISVTVTQL